MQHPSLVSATQTDIPTISELAHKIWNQHYPSIIGQAQIDYMLGKMYDKYSLKEQILIKKHRFYLIEFEGKAIGFISIYEESQNKWFIAKFYIDQTLAGKGLGASVFKEILSLTSAQSIRLTVNRENYKAINFYFKLGFKIEKVADFDIGQGYVMNDFVMLWGKV